MQVPQSPAKYVVCQNFLPKKLAVGRTFCVSFTTGSDMFTRLITRLYAMVSLHI